MKKIITGVLIAVLAAAAGFYIYESKQPSFELSETELTLELGESFDPEEHICQLKNADLKDFTYRQPADISKPGHYEIIYHLGKQSLTLKLTVQDTIAPKLSAAEIIKTAGGSLTEDEVLAAVSFEDKTDVKLTAANPLPDISVEGEYPVIVKAEDEAGNTAEIQVHIKINAPKPISISAAAPEPARQVPYSPSEKSTACWNAAGIDNQPYLVAVNRSLNTVTVYAKDAEGDYTVPYIAFPCSVGREGHETPTGRYNTTDRFEWCYMVDGSWGRYAIRIYRGIMFHSVCYFTKSVDNLEYEEFNKLGDPASLGCVRLCVRDVNWLFENCPWNFPVVIYDDDTTPGPLGKPDMVKIDADNENNRGWDPTDPNPESPWN